MALTAAERETIISWSDEDQRIHINTGQRRVITSLRKNPSFEETSFDEKNWILAGTLPLGAVTLRNKGKGMIKRADTVKRGRPNAATCSAMKADGTKCMSIAKKDTGRCSKHPL
jgi:hypothetical protein